jgi:kinesin family protein C1
VEIEDPTPRKREQIRRQMHSRIQELDGNIRVFVRTHPFLPGDGVKHDESLIVVSPDGESLSIVDHRGGDDHLFKFEEVFPPSLGQDLEFNEIALFMLL